MNTADGINSVTLSGLNQQENTFSKFVVETFNMMDIVLNKLKVIKTRMISSRRCDTKHSIKYSGHQISVFTSNLNMVCLFHKPSLKVINLLHFLKFHKETRPILLRLSLCYKNVMKVCGSIHNVVGCICTRT